MEKLKDCVNQAQGNIPVLGKSSGFSLHTSLKKMAEVKTDKTTKFCIGPKGNI